MIETTEGAGTLGALLAYWVGAQRTLLEYPWAHANPQHRFAHAGLQQRQSRNTLLEILSPRLHAFPSQWFCSQSPLCYLQNKLGSVTWGGGNHLLCKSLECHLKDSEVQFKVPCLMSFKVQAKWGAPITHPSLKSRSTNETIIGNPYLFGTIFREGSVTQKGLCSWGTLGIPRELVAGSTLPASNPSDSHYPCLSLSLSLKKSFQKE